MPTSRNITKKIANYDDPGSMGSKFRAKRIEGFLSLVEDIHREKGKVRILDVGGTRYYWNIVPLKYLEDMNVEITLVNLPGSNQPADEKHFIYREGDACNLSDIADNSYDIAHSNSVIEHVGDWSKMKMYAEEIARVSNIYYVQTPNYWFPVEPHCMTPLFHWLPKPMRIWLVMTFNLGHWQKRETVDGAMEAIESARLLNKKMFRELFKDANHTTERFFLLPKSLIAIRKRK